MLILRRDVPTEPALSVPTPEPTPQAESPFAKPSNDANYEGADRSLVGVCYSRTLSRCNAKGIQDIAGGLLGGPKKNKQSGGLVYNLPQTPCDQCLTYFVGWSTCRISSRWWQPW